MPHTPLPPNNRDRAKAMRRKMTPAELKLWNEVRAHRLMGLSIRRQFEIGQYIVDFACPLLKLVVELDGSQHGDDDAAERDARRTAFLEANGWTVIRFWNDDVLRDIDGVCKHIVTSAGLAAEDAAVQAGRRGSEATYREEPRP
jgi:very-short-patch-repair endonuclease